MYFFAFMWKKIPAQQMLPETAKNPKESVLSSPSISPHRAIAPPAIPTTPKKFPAIVYKLCRKLFTELCSDTRRPFAKSESFPEACDNLISNASLNDKNRPILDRLCAFSYKHDARQVSYHLPGSRTLDQKERSSCSKRDTHALRVPLKLCTRTARGDPHFMHSGKFRSVSMTGSFIPPGK